MADYDSYLSTGKVTYSGPLSDLLDRYIMIKGGHNELTPGITDTIIGLTTSRVGFSGIWPADTADTLPDSIVLETVDLETLMIAFGQGRRAHA